ncbi:hypothetical protein D3C75_794280 [compost metagenome]
MPKAAAEAVCCIFANLPNDGSSTRANQPVQLQVSAMTQLIIADKPGLSLRPAVCNFSDDTELFPPAYLHIG